jgi:hypothetical protein
VVSSFSLTYSPGKHTVSSATTTCIPLPDSLLSAICILCKSSVQCMCRCGLVVANTGTTNHILPDASAFISYKQVSNLDVQMGNNSYVAVLGRGTAIFLLNGKRLLIWNVLHVPGLAVLLYSLHAHLQLRGCVFIGSFDNGCHICQMLNPSQL